jgi:hypothetical protein
MPAKPAVQHSRMVAVPDATLETTLATTFLKTFPESLWLCVFGSQGSRILLFEKTGVQSVPNWTAYRELALQTRQCRFA